VRVENEIGAYHGCCGSFDVPCLIGYGVSDESMVATTCDSAGSLILRNVRHKFSYDWSYLEITGSASLNTFWIIGLIFASSYSRYLFGY
jgi:hypothetical protein